MCATSSRKANRHFKAAPPLYQFRHRLPGPKRKVQLQLLWNFVYQQLRNLSFLFRNAMSAANSVVCANLIMGGFDPLITLDEADQSLPQAGMMITTYGFAAEKTEPVGQTEGDHSRLTWGYSSSFGRKPSRLYAR